MEVRDLRLSAAIDLLKIISGYDLREVPAVSLQIANLPEDISEHITRTAQGLALAAGEPEDNVSAVIDYMPENVPEEENSTSNLGKSIPVPGGIYKNQILEDLYYTHGIKVLADMMSTLPMIGRGPSLYAKEGITVQESILFDLELFGFFFETLKSVHNVEDLTGFGRLTAGIDVESIVQKKKEGKLTPEEEELEVQKIKDKISEISQRYIFYETDLLTPHGEWICPEGTDFPGETIRNVYKEHKLLGIVQLLLTTYKSFPDTYKQTVDYLSTILPMIESHNPHREFLKAFQKFFRLTDEELEEELKRPEAYHTRVDELLKRMSA